MADKVKFLSQEWLDLQLELAAEFPERLGATARMQYVIKHDGDDDVKFFWVVEDGHLKESKLGEDDDAEFTMTVSYDDYVALNKGELDPTTAYMQNRLKVEGDLAKLMAMIPLTESAEYKAIQLKIHEQTEY